MTAFGFELCHIRNHFSVLLRAVSYV